MSRTLTLLFIFINTLLISNAQHYYDFKHISIEDGLSSNQVNDVYKDAEGFIWFSTAWGLNRYDGYNIIQFFRDGEGVSLPDNYVNWVRDIEGERLLISCKTGYVVYNKRTDTFVDANQFFRSMGIDNKITFLHVDQYKNIWIVCDNFFYCYHDALDGVRQIDVYVDDGVWRRYVSAIAVGSTKAVILFNDGAIAELSMSITGHVLIEPTAAVETPIESDVRSAFIDSAGDIWVCTTNDELWHCGAKSGLWLRCQDKQGALYRLPQCTVRCVAEGKDHNIWVGTDHGGIFIIDKRNGQITNVLQSEGDERSLVTNTIYSLFLDNQGVMWIDYFNAGVSLFDESMFKFAFDGLKAINFGEFRPHVNCIEEAPNGDLWFGTNDCGLIRYVKSTGKYEHYLHSDDDPNSIPSNIIVTIKVASNGDVWVGTFLGGLSRFDGRNFQNFIGLKNVPKAMASENIWAIEEDTEKNIWIGSLNEGLVRYSPDTHAIRVYNKASHDLPQDAVMSLSLSRGGDLLVGTSDGLVTINTHTYSSRIYNFEGEFSVFNLVINDVYEDSRNLLWLCSNNGILVVNPRTGVNTMINTKNGLENDVVNGIVEDENRNIWVSTACGLSNIVVNTNPRTDDYNFKVYNYGKQDGLQAGGFNVRSIEQTSAGEVLVGGAFGVNRFFPSQIHYNKTAPEVHFTGLSILGEPVGVHEDVGGYRVLHQTLEYSNKIDLGHNLNMFTISFSSLSSILPEKVTYSYKLEGFNDNWITTKQPSATYTNLAPGTYKLYVMAYNCDGYSSDGASLLTIRVLSPWYLSIWAIIIYILILGLVLMRAHKHAINRHNIKFKIKQMEADAARQIEVDNIKMKFFTNISHELRTPLSLIITPLETIIANTNDEELKGKLKIVYRNASRLFELVNQLLDFRKIDESKFQVTLSNGDIVDFIKNACSEFSSISERNLQMTFSSSEDSIYMEFDRDIINKVMNNLLSNAIKYTNEDGRIDVWVGKSTNGNRLIIKVADTGVGIPDECKEHIFERFYQVQRPNAGSYGGSGIGLHMVHELVTFHGGTIEVADNIGRGTVFTVQLPIAENVNTREAQQEDVDALPADIEENAENSEQNEAEDTRPVVLVVDDNPDFRLLIADTLKPDYNIIEARDGAEAFALAVSKMPDLVLADVMMPVMDGIELCRKMKNDVRTSHIPFVMLSAKTAEEHKIEGLSVGADEYMTKPFNDKILKLKVARLTDLSKSRHETFSKQIEPEPSQITVTTLDEKLISKAIKYVEDNISNPDLSVEEMSRNLGMSRVHLYKKLLSITGRSPIEFIRVIRLKRAAQLLSDKQQNVSDVAYAVGFNNPKYFSRYFKDEFGVLPSVYQQSRGVDTRATI